MEKNAENCCCCAPQATQELPHQKEVPAAPKLLRVAGSLGLGFLYAFFPKCPVCWAAWMSVFSTFGLAKIPYQPWLLPVLGLLLVVHLALMVRGIRQKGYGPLVLSLTGAATLLTARWLNTTDALVYLGMAQVGTGAFWNSFDPATMKNLLFKMNTYKMKNTKSIVQILIVLCCMGNDALFSQAFSDSLPIPPLYEGEMMDGVRFYNIELDTGSHAFTPGGTVYKTMGFNTMGYLGPTLLWNNGDSVQMRVHNHLHHETTVHWHGAHVPPRADGGPHEIIEADAYWWPSFRVMDPPATMWYHPHLHEHTLQQVNKGLAAMIIIRDPNDPFEALLPHSYGVDEFPIVVQDKDLTADTISTTCTMGITFLVNGVENPYLEVPAQQVRFRMLNAGSERVFGLQLSDNTPFKLIATDAGYTEKPLPEINSVIGSGERVEWVMDFTGRAGQTLYLDNVPTLLGSSMPGNPAPAVPGCYNNGMQNYVDSFPVHLMEIRVVAPTSAPITTIPANFAPLSIPDINDVSVVRKKRLLFSGNNAPPFLIDSIPFSLSFINENVILNSTEIWKITNTSGVAHPFHIHDISFHILSMTTLNEIPIPIPTYMQGPKDVVLVPDGTIVRFITKFTDFASAYDADYSYMYHCHILSHEDGGMMGQFVVTYPPVGVKPEAVEAADWQIFPNPGSGILNISGDSEKESVVEMYDTGGRKVAQYKLPPLERQSPAILTKKMNPGVYMVKWIREDNISTRIWVAE